MCSSAPMKLSRWEKAGSNYGVISNAPCLCRVLRDKGMGRRCKQQRRQEEGGGPHGCCCVSSRVAVCMCCVSLSRPSSSVVRHFSGASAHPTRSTRGTISNPTSCHSTQKIKRMARITSRYDCTALLQTFAVKFVLEVLGAAGAIWGSSEAIGLRTETNRPVFHLLRAWWGWCSWHDG